MGTSTDLGPSRVTWNKGRLTGQKPPLKLKVDGQIVWQMAARNTVGLLKFPSVFQRPATVK